MGEFLGYVVYIIIVISLSYVFDINFFYALVLMTVIVGVVVIIGELGDRKSNEMKKEKEKDLALTDRLRNKYDTSE